MNIKSYAHLFFSLSIASIGILDLVIGDFAQCQPVPEWVPLRGILAYASGTFMLVTGIGLLFRTTFPWMMRVLMVFLLAWLLLLDFPFILTDPANEISWLVFGMISIIVAGGIIICTGLSVYQMESIFKIVNRENGVRIARLLFGISLPLIGLSHFMYLQETVVLIPAWLPGHIFWAYLTGAGHIAAGLGVLFGILPRLAAVLETIMLWIFTTVVWIPIVVSAPTVRFNWSEILISSAIASGAWLVADSYREAPWFTKRKKIVL